MSPLVKAKQRLSALRALCALTSGSSWHPPPSEAIAWGDVVDLATENGLAATLLASLAHLGLDGCLTSAERRRLDVARIRTALARRRLQRQLAEVMEILQRAQVASVVLKGGAMLTSAWDDGGDIVARLARARVMIDLDLLVPPADHPAAIDALHRAGYELDLPGYATEHALSFAAEGQPGQIDLHRALGFGAVPSVLPALEVLERSEPAEVLGVACRVPSAADALVHCIVHAELQDLNYRVGGIGVRQLQTFVLLYRRLADDKVWIEVCDRLVGGGLGRVHGAHAELVRRLFAVDLPRPESTTAARRHARRCLLGFALGPVPDAHRNVLRAFDPPYMRERYAGLPLPLAQIRHATHLVVHRREGLVDELFVGKVR